LSRRQLFAVRIAVQFVQNPRRAFARNKRGDPVIHRGSQRIAIACQFCLLTILLFSNLAAAQRIAVHSLAGPKFPYGGLVLDKAGNLYGTTEFGGDNNQGTVFKVTVDSNGNWTETVLYSFAGAKDGGQPHAGLILDAAGNLYGTTALGGGGSCSVGCGTVFELKPSSSGWTETVLYTFTGDSDGRAPYARLVFDAAGNLYGTTLYGGKVGTICSSGCGTVFQLSPSASQWKETVLHAFAGGDDGSFPYSGLTLDAVGRLYGATQAGGANADGTVFKLTSGSGGVWTESVIHTFTGGNDGKNPVSDLIVDGVGNLYGTASQSGAAGYGMVFELVPRSSGSWTEEVIHTFIDQPGANPMAGLVMDSAGNLYGTTMLGANLRPCGGGCGTLYKLAPASGWTFSVLHLFGRGTDGYHPSGDVILDPSGNLYGTTQAGGTTGRGTVFRISSAAAPFSIVTASLSSGSVDSRYSSTFTASGGTSPFTWSLVSGQLPPGLTLASSGTITGTPSTSGTYNFSVKVVDSSSPQQSASGSFSIFIAGLLSIATTSPLPSATVGTVYSETFSVSGGTPPYDWGLTAGLLPPGLTLANSGILSGTPTSSGSYNFSIQVIDSGAPQQTASGAFSISVAGGALTITTTSLPSTTVGMAYSSTLAASGGISPYSWALASGNLPPGLTLASNGTISGTPTASGQYSFTAKVTDSSSPAQSASSPFSISVTSGSSTLSITTTSLPSGIEGSSYSSVLSASGGTPPYSWVVSSGNLAPGLTLASNGTISGTPTASGQYSFTAKVTDSGSPAQSASAPLSISIASRVTATPGATATQYVMSYTAANSSQCTIEVSTSPSYTPLVHALDPTLFANANLDGQTNAGPRAFVIGQRWIATENVNPPSIRVGASSASRTPMTIRGGYGLIYGEVTVTYTDQPFVAGDNIVVTGMGNSAYNTTLGRVMSASTNSLTYFVPTSATDTSGGGIIRRANSYSLALQNTTTYYFRVGGASNPCGASPATGSFTTMNWPNGDTWAENAALGSNGVPVLPTIPESQDDSVAIIDPITGTLMKPMSLFSDDNGYGQKGAGGAKCSWQADSNGFYHCYDQFGNSGAAKLYGINETTGEVRFLGQLTFSSNIGECGTNSLPSVNPNGGGVWDTTNPNVLYGICATAASYGTHADVFEATYNGNDVAVTTGAGTGVEASFAPLVILTPSATGKSLDELMAAFDSRFNFTLEPGFGALYVDSGYLALSFSRWNQGSPTWNVMFNLESSSIAGAMAEWGPGLAATSCAGTAPYYCSGLYPFRWNGSHSMGQFDGPAYGWADASLSYMTGGGTMGPFNVTLNQGAGLNATDATDTITVTSTIVGSYGSTGDPCSTTIPPDGNCYLDQALPGDFFIWTVGGEIDEVLVRNSATSLTIARGCHLDTSSVPYRAECDGTGETTHTNRATFYMAPLEFVGNCCNFSWWNFTNDPHGHDRTATNLIPDEAFLVSHWDGTNPIIVDEGWNIKNNAIWNASFLTAGADYAISTAPPFAGINNQCGGSSCNMYPHYEPASPSSQPWFWESAAYSGKAYNDLVATVVSSGTGYVIARYNFSTNPVNPFSPTLPYFSVSGLYSLADISAPSSALAASSAGNYTFCIVHVASECWSGSSVGEVYANLPSTPVACSAAEAGVFTGNDWCISNMFSMISGVEQVGTTAANVLETQPDGTPLYGAANSRKIVQNLRMPPRWVSSVGVNTIPDDSWVWTDTCIADPYINTYTSSGENPNGLCLDEVYLFKIPPQPPDDGIDRTNYESVSIPIGPGSSGATYAQVKYGYEENEPIRGTTWPPAINFYCTQYKGACVSESLSLNSTAQLAIGVPQRVLFYEVEYLNSSNQVVTSDPITAITIP
jgi:uncharacterized repeat protein (TIGR03803 family)